MRNVSLLAAATVLLLIGGCSDHGLQHVPPDPCIGCQPNPWPTEETRDVDLLFVVDNSGSMADEQAEMRRNYPVFIQELRSMEGGLPNLHIGVTTTDLGTGMFQITYCEDAGEAGALVTRNCTNPTGGAPYIIDVEPRSCEITREANNQCSAHTCSQANCSHEPTTTFVEDSSTGCPRCRNYQNESLEDVFSCISAVGTMGCGFEQPLEAMYKALDPANTANVGFIRENAMLGIVLLSDEDDCSASNAQLYDNTQRDMSSTLGPLTSYRCHEFGTTCDINSRTLEGTRQNCVPREDAAAMLHPLSRYIQFLQALKHPSMLVVTAIAGPVTPSSDGVGFDANVSLDASGYPGVGYSCTNTADGATPGIRIHSLVEAFQTEADLDWAYTSVCGDAYGQTLTGIGRKIAAFVTANCPTQPFYGCADVGVEFGSPQAAQTCAVNAQCLAQCQVTDVFERGLPTEVEYEVPPCLQVAPDGTLLEENTDRTLAYAAGHPDARDPDLPVPACWHIQYEPQCEASNSAELVIARKTDPPPRSFSDVACASILSQEQECNDGEDNDEDCLVDQDDPDCTT